MKKTLLTILTSCLLTAGVSAQASNYSIGSTVTNFTVVDAHGATHDLSTIAASGKWILIDFFFTTCGPCQATVPFFSELHEKYGCNAGDLYCISIDLGDTDAEVLAFESAYSISSGHSPAPAVSGTEGGGDAVVADFGVGAFPTYCLVGPDMKMKNNDIWPVSSITQFESAMTAANFTPNVMSCSAAGLAEVTSDEITIHVFPNPAVNTAAFELNLNANEAVVAYVYNTVGALVSTTNFNGTVGSNKFELNTSSLENGQYILRVQAGNERHQQTAFSVIK
ncbi:MAG: T9SS type A sorting domain-containing protein [Crocinitomicaceae bacterium]